MQRAVQYANGVVKVEEIEWVAEERIIMKRENRRERREK